MWTKNRPQSWWRFSGFWQFLGSICVIDASSAGHHCSLSQGYTNNSFVGLWLELASADCNHRSGKKWSKLSYDSDMIGDPNFLQCKSQRLKIRCHFGSMVRIGSRRESNHTRELISMDLRACVQQIAKFGIRIIRPLAVAILLDGWYQKTVQTTRDSKLGQQIQKTLTPQLWDRGEWDCN